MTTQAIDPFLLRAWAWRVFVLSLVFAAALGCDRGGHAGRDFDGSRRESPRASSDAGSDATPDGAASDAGTTDSGGCRPDCRGVCNGDVVVDVCGVCGGRGADLISCGRDRDEDGILPASPESARFCSVCPEGWLPLAPGRDCDDLSDSIQPGATETCNGRDDDCDSKTDEDGAALCSPEGTVGDCVRGSCTVDHCTVGYELCDPEKGCERVDRVDRCGSCDTTCTAGSRCVPVTEGFACACPSGTYGLPGDCRPFSVVGAMVSRTCALNDAGSIECWGDGALSAPHVRAALSERFDSFTVGWRHACAIDSAGIVECWGDTEYGKAPSRQDPAPGTIAVGVAVGDDHSCLLDSDGVIECWGDDRAKQAPARLRPPVGDRFVQVSASGWRTCALTGSGGVLCWGYGVPAAESTIVRTSGAGRFVSIDAGVEVNCALLEDGSAECWDVSSLAHSTLRPRSGTPFVSVSTEASHYCALTRGGVVECWGDDRYGQAAAETRAPDGLAFVDLAAGAYYTCALASDGTVRCWGGDVYGAAPAIIRSEFGDAFGG